MTRLSGCHACHMPGLRLIRRENTLMPTRVMFAAERSVAPRCSHEATGEPLWLQTRYAMLKKERCADAAGGSIRTARVIRGAVRVRRVPQRGSVRTRCLKDAHEKTQQRRRSSSRCRDAHARLPPEAAFHMMRVDYMPMRSSPPRRPRHTAVAPVPPRHRRARATILSRRAIARHFAARRQMRADCTAPRCFFDLCADSPDQHAQPMYASRREDVSPAAPRRR